jgi:hypothetical protein
MRFLFLLLIACVLAAGVVFGSLLCLDDAFRESFKSWMGMAKRDMRVTYSDVRAKMTTDQWAAARQAARGLSGRCEELVRERSGDADMMLGVAFIHKNFPSRKCTYGDALDRVLTAKPDSIPALALKNELATSLWLANLQAGQTTFDRVVSQYRSRGLGRLVFSPTDEPVYSLIRADDPFARTETSSVNPGKLPTYIVDDVSVARAALLARMQSGLPELLASLDAAAIQDANNGYYEYMKARIFLVTQQQEKAIEAARLGVSKGIVTNYVDVARAEALKVMDSEKYPRICRDCMATAGTPAGAYVANLICRDGLDKIARERRTFGDQAGAADVAGLAQQIRKQCGGDERALADTAQ